MRLSFVLPMYNEALNIEAMVAMIRRQAAPLLEDYEVVIIDDASSDGCGTIADGMAAHDSHLQVIHHPHNRGLGASIRSGFAAVRMPYVLYSDSDLPVDFSCLRWVLPKVKPEVNLLVGYRLGRAEGMRRAVMSWGYNRLIRVLFGLRVRDVNFAFKLIRRDLLQRLDLRSEGSFIDAEILLEARRVGAHPVEVGLQYHTRQAGVSSLSSAAAIWGIFRELGAYVSRDEQPAPRRVIVNGDDFGLHSQINRAIREAHCQGVLTSASILAGGPAFAEAAAIAREHPDLEVGVHLALTQLPACSAAGIAAGRGEGRLPDSLLAVLWRVVGGGLSEQRIEAEFRAQIERVRAAGLRITHLDGHQHLHVLPSCARVVARLARQYGISAVRLPREPIHRPVGVGLARAGSRLLQGFALRLACWWAARIFRHHELSFPDRFFGFANGGCMEHQITSCLALAGHGITEIACHPGQSSAELDRVLKWGYHWEDELASLCRPACRTTLASVGARLGSWSDCQPRPACVKDARAISRAVNALPPYLWFGVIALLVSCPLDPLDGYGALIVAVGTALHFALASGKTERAQVRKPLLVFLSVVPYVGFALWANNLWLVPAAMLAATWCAWRGLVALAAVPFPASGRRRLWLAALVLLVLGACFEIREERQEALGIRPGFLGLTHRQYASATTQVVRPRGQQGAAAAEPYRALVKGLRQAGGNASPTG